MSLNRSLVRLASVTTAAGTLAVGTASAASAATVTHAVAGTTVTATFTTDTGEVGDACAAALTTPAHAAVVADRITRGALDVLATLPQDRELILLTTQSSPIATPNVLTGPVTLTATQVPANAYALLTYCVSSKAPTVQTVTVGDPLAVAQGSMQSLSAEGAPEALSSVLGKAVTGGTLTGR